MTDYYPKDKVEEITKKYHWVNGMDEYLMRTGSEHLEKFTALRNAIFYGNPYKIKEYLSKSKPRDKHVRRKGIKSMAADIITDNVCKSCGLAIPRLKKKKIELNPWINDKDDVTMLKI